MSLLKDEGGSKHVYLRGRWLSCLIYLFLTHSPIRYFRARFCVA